MFNGAEEVYEAVGKLAQEGKKAFVEIKSLV